MLQRIHHPEEEEEQEEEEARIPTMGMGSRRFGGMPQGGKDPKEAVAETRQQGGEGEVTSSSLSVSAVQATIGGSSFAVLAARALPVKEAFEAQSADL